MGSSSVADVDYHQLPLLISDYQAQRQPRGSPIACATTDSALSFERLPANDIDSLASSTQIPHTLQYSIPNFSLAFRALQRTGLALSLGLTALAAYQGIREAMADHPRGFGSQAPRLDASGPRNVVFCHQCEHEWYQDEAGLVCPRCDGEITEIVTPESDPRPEREVHPPNDARNPIEIDSDPEEADIEEHITHGPGGSVLFSGTIRTSSPRDPFRMPPRRRGNPHDEDPDFVMRDFHNMLGNIMGPQFRPGQAGRSGANTLFTQDNGFGGQTFRVGGDGNGPTIVGGRFTFGGPNARQQGGADFQQPGGPPPVPDLATIITSLFAPMGPPGQRDGPHAGGLGPDHFHSDGTTPNIQCTRSCFARCNFSTSQEEVRLERTGTRGQRRMQCLHGRCDNRSRSRGPALLSLVSRELCQCMVKRAQHLPYLQKGH